MTRIGTKGIVCGIDQGGNIADLADVAQLVERNLAKVEVAGSNPVVRSAEGGR